MIHKRTDACCSTFVRFACVYKSKIRTGQTISYCNQVFHNRKNCYYNHVFHDKIKGRVFDCIIVQIVGSECERTMWKNIRKRWDQLFVEEEREEHLNMTEDRSSTKNKTVEAKMAYQYPKHQQNNNRTQKQQTTSRRKPQQKHTNKEERQTQATPQLEKRQPFKAQDVPSPIYGFHHRKVKRNEPNEAPKPMEPTVPETQEMSKPMESKVPETQETPKQMESNSIETPKAQMEKTRSVSRTEQKEEKQSDISTEKQAVKEHKKASSSKHVEIAKVAQTEKRQRPNQTKNQKPLNVMMTPRDKWRMKEKEKRETPTKVEDKQEATVSDKEIQPRSYSVPMHLLDDVTEQKVNQTPWINEQAETLQNTLRYFNIKAKVVDVTQGPSVTRFEIQPEPGVKVSKIKNLTDDIKMNLAARDIRMEAPIPGKHTIGIEVPNENAEPVFLHKMLDSEDFLGQHSPLTVALGADIEGSTMLTDLKKMPHGLIAGATGSGKSVCINTILISLLYKANHDEVKFLLIDPKMVELAPYNELPHLVAPVITDVKAATSSLKWAVQEMEDRYQRFVEEGARDIQRYNQKVVEQQRPEDKMPYIVIVIDELADLMMTAPQDVEDAICRIAQKARACGIHLLIATQRPSVDVITGLIKANVPTRIAFSVSSQIDSRTILDSNGAEKLLGKGDMLFIENGSGEMKRIQGAFVSDDEIERVTSYVKQIASPEYLFEQEQLIQQSYVSEEVDALYHEAVDFVLKHNGASASLLQRRFKIGYNRAARLIDSMEDNGVISGQNGSKQREVLISSLDTMNE